MMSKQEISKELEKTNDPERIRYFCKELMESLNARDRDVDSLSNTVGGMLAYLSRQDWFKKDLIDGRIDVTQWGMKVQILEDEKGLPYCDVRILNRLIDDWESVMRLPQA